eukprot:SAG25_NODE_4302_length_845_cov_1.152815_1_plen_93_part_00
MQSAAWWTYSVVLYDVRIGTSGVALDNLLFLRGIGIGTEDSVIDAMLVLLAAAGPQTKVASHLIQLGPPVPSVTMPAPSASAPSPQLGSQRL